MRGKMPRAPDTHVHQEPSSMQENSDKPDDLDWIAQRTLTTGTHAHSHLFGASATGHASFLASELHGS